MTFESRLKAAEILIDVFLVFDCFEPLYRLEYRWTQRGRDGILTCAPVKEERSAVLG